LKLPDLLQDDTIVALSTAQGTAAIAVIRISGKNAFEIVNKVFKSRKKTLTDLSKAKTQTIHFGEIKDNGFVVDEVLVSLFKAPYSYTGENIIEISCHGSQFVQQTILQLMIKSGARLAKPGEFTLRAFLNGKFDLLQAEAVSDLITSSSSVAHQSAMQQMRGGFSNQIKILRQSLVDFASLIELELDFSEEDVEFANRDDLKKLVTSILHVISRLVESFEVGNVIKNGIPVAIVGKPNVGKSTLLNTLIEEERAIVSEIPGTTRDTIEDELNIDGVPFRLIDTAGIRETTDIIESIGVSKTFTAIKNSSIVIYVFDLHEITSSELLKITDDVKKHLNGSQLVIVANKIDKEDVEYSKKEFEEFKNLIFISAKEKINIDALKRRLVELFDNRTVNATETIVTNARHAEALNHSKNALERVYSGLETNITGDLLAIDIRSALHYLGEITGEVTTNDLLENIFGKFCIGK
jgi:tRNA modification GTPase